jgi:hypothetical protein
MRMLKNTKVENQVLDREINRMHQIDRIKVANAKTSLFSPDAGKCFPSLEVFNASIGGSASIPVDVADMLSPGATSRNVVTSNELSGICERLGGLGGVYSGVPSQRQRIVIARKQE